MARKQKPINAEAVLRGAREVFFQEMPNGWAGDRNPTTIGALPGSHSFSHYPKRGQQEFKIEDCFVVGEAASAGFTMIWFRHGHLWKPIWHMSYDGSYQKVAIPFLKSRLLKAYREKVWCGGRGVGGHKERSDLTGGRNFVYYNDFGLINLFSRTKGMETIRDSDTEELLGMHRYSCISLLAEVDF